MSRSPDEPRGDPERVDRRHDETRRRLDGPAIAIALPLLVMAAFVARYGIDRGHDDAHPAVATDEATSARTATTERIATDAATPVVDASDVDGANAAADAFVQAKTMTMPHLQPILPPGPGLETVEINCVTCHSPRLITNQPHFSRAQWTDTVHKMVNTFGAHVTPADQAKIVDYLVFIRGDESTPTAAAPGSPTRGTTTPGDAPVEAN